MHYLSQENFVKSAQSNDNTTNGIHITINSCAFENIDVGSNYKSSICGQVQNIIQAPLVERIGPSRSQLMLKSFSADVKVERPSWLTLQSCTVK